MNIRGISVQTLWDPDAQVWVALSRDIGGLAVEAPTQRQLKDKVDAAIEDLLEANSNL